MQIFKLWLAGLMIAAVAAWGVPAFAADDSAQSKDAAQEEVNQEEEDGGIISDLIPSPELRLTGPNAIDNLIVEAGGGLQGFSGDLGDNLEGGASWTARAVIGARSLIGAEIAYTGGYYSVENVDNLDINFEVSDPLDTTGMVVSTNVNAMARVNLLNEKAVIKPFVAGGAGYYRLDSDFDQFNNVGSLALPIAAGIQTFPYSNVSIAARAEWTFLTAGENDFPNGDQWGTMLTAGANF